MRSFFFALALIAAACGAASPPAPAANEPISITDAWAAPTPGGVDVSAGYISIANSGAEADRLIAAASPRAERVEIHTMDMEGGVMRMRPLDALTIPAGGSASLSPGGDHLMFFGVAEPFAAGQEIPVRLTFEHAGEIDVVLVVRRGGAHSGH